MPRRDDISSILVIGSGPIVIGQACEFDYSGTQACRVLREEGYRVILANSNPATIMTDPDFADRTYVEPLTPEVVARIIERERPDAVLPTLGGQTGLNIAMALFEMGLIGVPGTPEMIGANAEAIATAEDREKFKVGHGRHRPRRAPLGQRPHDRGGPRRRRRHRPPGDHPPGVHPRRPRHGHRPHHGRVRAPRRRRHRRQPDRRDPRRGVDRRVEGVRARGHARPGRQLRDHLLDRERRPDGRAHRRLDHGGPGPDADRRRVPADARCRVRLHPPRRRGDRRLQRPVRARPGDGPAGRHRDEPAGLALVGAGVQGDRASRSPRSPPAWPSATRSTRSPTTSPRPRRPASSRSSTTSSRRSRAGRSRSCPARRASSAPRCSPSARPWPSAGRSPRACRRRCARWSRAASGSTATRPRTSWRRRATTSCWPPSASRRRTGCSRSASCCAAASPVERVNEACRIDIWFLDQMLAIIEQRHELDELGGPDALDTRAWRRAKRLGFSDAQLGHLWDTDERVVRAARQARGVEPTYKTVDTCAAEFAAATPYHYSTWEDETEVQPSDRPRVIILGSGPNRIGQGIEFDYCCVHASFALRDAGFETVMINCNPETVSTDYDTSDRLYFEPLTGEDVEHVIAAETAAGRRRAAQGHRVARRADPAQAGVADPARADRRDGAVVDRPGRGPREVERAVRRAAHPPAARRHGDRPRAGAQDRRRHRLPGPRAPELRARRAGHADRPRRRPAVVGDGRAGRVRQPRARGRPVGRAPRADRPLPR